MWGKGRNISFSLKKQVTYITGFNGSGKSTILDILNTSLQDSNKSRLEHKEWVSKINVGLDADIFFTAIRKDSDVSPQKVYSIFSNNINKKEFRAKELGELITKERKKNIHISSVKKSSFYSKNEATYNHNSYLKVIKEKEKEAEKYHYIKLLKVVDGSSLNTKDIDSIVKPVFYRDDIYVIADKAYSYTGSQIINNLFDRDTLLNITLNELLFHFLSIEKSLNEEKSSSEKKILITALHDLLSSDIDFEQKKNIEETIKKINKDDINIDIQKFDDLVNEYFSCTKKIITRDVNGVISFKSIDSSDDDIPWLSLSKGEKQILVLLLLAFIYSKDSRVFILDEPDLSLHVDWQKNIIASMVQLSPESQFIIATHSPVLFMNDVDFEVINTMDL